MIGLELAESPDTPRDRVQTYVTLANEAPDNAAS